MRRQAHDLNEPILELVGYNRFRSAKAWTNTFSTKFNDHPGGVMATSDILRTIRNLLPAVRTRRQEIEQARCMPRDLVDELRKTKMFSLSVPRVIGGEEARPVDIMRTIETVASADGS